MTLVWKNDGNETGAENNLRAFTFRLTLSGLHFPAYRGNQRRYVLYCCGPQT